MDKIILKLLKENGRVIIPDFGALIVKQKSPFTVIFNEFLQYNDGALISAIEADLKIERDDAASKARELTTELQNKLKKGEDVTLTGIGVLTKSSTGKITLKDVGEKPATPPAAKETAKPESSQSEAKTVEFDLEEDKKSKPPASASKPVSPPPESKPVEKKEIPSTAPKKEIPGGIPSPPPKKELPKSPPKKEIPTPSSTPRSEPVKAPAEAPPIAEYYSESGGKSKLSIILWILVILIVNGAIVGFFFYREEIKAYFKKSDDPLAEEVTTSIVQEEEATIDAPLDTVQETEESEPLIETTADEVEEQPQVEQEMFAGTKYYVVAGVFRIESNADRLVAKLRNQGYNSEKFARIGRMHAVSYDVFPSKRDADRLMLKIKREDKVDAWIKILD